MSQEHAYPCAYLAYTIKVGDSAPGTLDELIDMASNDDSLVREFLKGVVVNIELEQLVAAATKLSEENLKAYLLDGPVIEGRAGGDIATPDGLASLAAMILGVQEGERVIDFGSGAGNLLERIAQDCSAARCVGVELNSSRVAIARIRSNVSASGIAYEHDDMFSYYELAVAGNKADKAFSNYPWGMRAKQLQGKSEYLKKVLKGMSEYGRPNSADWVFNRLLLDSIKEDGVAIGIMTNGSAFNGADARVRKYFIENGWVRAAISLPKGIFFPWANIGTTLVVLSYGNTEGVRLVDATDLGTKERRGMTLTDEDARVIVERLNSDSDRSAFASIDKLAKRDFTLSSARFLEKEIELNNPVALGDLMLDITRGAGLRASELDKLTCAEDTGIHYLNLANIVDGSIDDDLPCLKELDSKLEKYCLETGDLLLSKNGAPYKVTIAEVPEGQKILANGNLYIIKLDTEKVDPYFVAAFLNSTDGKELLARASRGTTIPNLPLKELQSIRIPLENREKQAHIAAVFQAKLDEIGVLKLRLSRARKELVDLFDEEA
ncbi:N-6 DNA methylase [Enorma sp.]|uniref:N-6 DNA methylase n=1 Tax=Enorma sp. TaxID=1920692 RepID=UPI0025BC8542|nr:N-6 DNA methylase [Enorma sp.]